MKILLCHNHYQIRAGEDSVFDSERKLLIKNGHSVDVYSRDSQEIKSFSLIQKILFLFSTFYNPRTVRDISKIITENRPDVAHIHNVFPLISPSIYYALKKHNIPIVQTMHNFRFLCPNALLFCHGIPCQPKHFRFFKCIFTKCYRDSLLFSALYAAVIFSHRVLKTYQRTISKFIFLNPFSQKVFNDNGFVKNTTVNPNFVEPLGLESQANHDYFVFVGRFSDEKGIMTLLQALKLIKPFKTIIVGDGPLKTEVVDFIEQNNLDNVTLTGYLSHQECVQYMANAKVSIFPYECYENCPLTIINSLWYGTPVVAADIGGVSSFVPKKAGWLVKSADPQDLATRLDWIIDNLDQVQALRESSKIWAQENFSAKVHHKHLIDIYNSIIGS